MFRAYNHTCKVTLPAYGEVTISAEYYPGYPGSYWAPPESDEMEIQTVTDLKGQVIHLTDEQVETHYDLIMDALYRAHYEYESRVYGNDNLTLDQDIPF